MKGDREMKEKTPGMIKADLSRRLGRAFGIGGERGLTWDEKKLIINAIQKAKDFCDLPEDLQARVLEVEKIGY